MLSNRSLLLATACALPVSLVACGGGDDGAAGGNPPTGTHYGYVVSKANVAPTAQPGHTYTDYGLDLGSPKGTDLDKKVDNQIGQALLTLSSFFDVQGTVDTAINAGAIILLVDFQSESFTSSNAAGLTVKFGANAQPAPCTDPANATTCGQHLKGGATFSVATDSPADAELTGKVANGTFNSDSGNVGLAIALGDAATPVNLDLVHARVKASGISANGITTANVGGLITQDELKTKVAPAILDSVNKLLTTAGCNITTGDPKATCGCTSTSTAITIILGQIDGDIAGSTKNCQITVDELLAFPPVQAVLKPDACSKDTCTAPDSFSIGVQVSAVKATIN